MASFTDNIPQFNPYVQQLPVEAMVAVGMEKQRRYDEGYQKIQASIDAIAGLEVSKDVERAYLQSKLNELGNNLTTVAAGDFSNYQLVNSVDGMAKQLVYDPNIQTALASTAKRKKEFEFMEEARKKGELTPENETYFAKRDAAWLNNSELGQSYNAKYVPFFDVLKYAKETFDSIKPDNWSFDEVYKKGSDGNYVTDKNGNLVLNEAITRMKEEGYLPAKLEATIDQIFNDPRVNQQLSISGEYSYRGMSPEQLAISVTKEANKIKNTYEDKLDQLNIQLQLNPDSDEIKQQIKNTELAISKLGENLSETGELISSNPDAIRASLYKSKTKDNYTAMFNFSKKSTEIHTNPLWEAKFKIQQEANEQNRWAQEQAFNRYKFSAEYEQKERMHAENKKTQLELAKIKAGGKGSSGLGGGSSADGSGLVQDTEPSDLNIMLTHTEQVENAARNLDNSTIDLVWSTLWDGNTAQAGVNRKKLQQEMKATINGQPITEIEAKRRIIERYAKNKNLNYNDYMTDSKSSIVGKYNTPQSIAQLKKNNYQLYEKLQTLENNEFNFRFENDIDKRVKGDNLAEFYKKIESIPIREKNITIGKNNYVLTKEDMVDLAIIAKYKDKSWVSKKWETEEAEALKYAYEASRSRMEKKGKGQVINSFLDNALLDQTTRKKLKSATKLPSELEDSSAIGEWMFGVRDSRNKQRNFFNNRIFDDVYSIYDNLDASKFKEQVKNTASAIKKHRVISPNLVGGVSTGVDAQDKVILEQIKAIANAYNKNQNAVGVDADEVVSVIRGLKNFSDLREANIIRGIQKDGSGNPTPYIEIDGNKLFLNDAEANLLGVNPGNIYVNEYVNTVESFINSNQGYSSSGYINEVETYRQNDVVMDNKDFPLLQGSNYSAKVNFAKSNNKYYPYLYINNGENQDKVIPLPISSNNLGKLMMEDLPSYITPENLRNLLIKYQQ
jgi:hypothetical protein